jgi:single-stranded-DNA-specific exonuclease
MTEAQTRSLAGARWAIKQADEAAVQRLSRELGMGHITARALVCRGIVDPGAARAFLGHDLAALTDPFAMTDMGRAVDLIDSSLQRGACIRIYGDYDVDGVCATALLVRALGRLGGDVDWYIPHRIDEGYGLNEDAIREAHQAGVELLITVDCGSTAVAPIATANELGMQVIVTDHHRVGEELPAAPVLNPCRSDCSYPFKGLAGVGVAFKLVSALGRSRDIPQDQVLNFLDLVCLGTVADVVPLLGENRLFVQHGLGRLSDSRKAGIRALLDAARVGRDGAVGVRDVAFGLAPRINAAGRMEDARAAVRLLLTRDTREAEELAGVLSQHNAARRREEKQTLDEAQQIVASEIDLAREKVIVLASERWHPGVIGIVASRLVERHHRPTLLVALSGAEGKGSGRSITAFNLWDALRQCAPVLTGFGGHHFAAGFGIEAGRIEELRQRINEVADERLTQDDLLRRIEVDAEAPFEELTLEAVNELNELTPFGMGNPRPTLITRGVTVARVAAVGDGSHLSVRLSSAQGAAADGIWFGAGMLGEDVRVGQIVDVCYRASLDDWGGTPRVRLHLNDIAVRDGD